MVVSCFSGWLLISWLGECVIVDWSVGWMVVDWLVGWMDGWFTQHQISPKENGVCFGTHQYLTMFLMLNIYNCLHL